MFWRFGINSAIDGLLDKEDLTLEELLDEDDLLQECKAHNNKLVEYLRDPIILSQLLNYIIRDDLDERQRFKYPYVACEVFSCEIWTICETVIDNVDLLNAFWQFLDRPAPLNSLQASYFTKVNIVFLQKKMIEMVKFIQSIPNVVKKMLNHMETSAIMDLLLKLISYEEYPEGNGVIDWLNSEGLIEALISRLDPHLDPDIHSTTAQILIDIITISQSSNPEQGGVGPNALSKELISEKTVTRLVNYMLDPEAPNSTSSLTNGVNILMQIIQKNNCDFNEESTPTLSPHQPHPIVDLGDMLQVLANRIGDFKSLLENPKSVSGQIDTTIGKMEPLGFERFRICELFAELLHCSNMSLLNVVRQEIPVNGFYELKHDYSNYNPMTHTSEIVEVIQMQEKDHSQTVQTSCIEEVNQTNEVGEVFQTKEKDEGFQIQEKDYDSTTQTSDVEDVYKIQEKDYDRATQTQDTFQSQEKDYTQTQTNVTGEVFQEISELQTQNIDDMKQMDSNLPDSNLEQSTSVASPIFEHLQAPPGLEAVSQVSQFNQYNGLNSSQLPVGDILKSKFIEYRIIPTCLDLFFNFKWNNFLHTVVYDMVAQIFNGRMDIGYNKALAISVFTDGQLTKRITKAQRSNDYEVEQPKGVRLGYMGHQTFIAEEVVKLLDRYAVEIGEKVREYIEAEDWQEYVSKTLRETRERDRAPLGGQRPSNHDSMSPSREESEDDDDDDTSEAVADGDMASDQFARYLCQQITNDLPDKFGSSDESDDDEEEGWMGDVDYEMRGPFSNPNMIESDHFENRRSSLGDDFGADSDEDDSSTQWSTSNMHEHKQLLTVADWSAAEFQGFKTSTKTASKLSANTPSSSATTNSVPSASHTDIVTSVPTTSEAANTNEGGILVNNVKDGNDKDSNVTELVVSQINVSG
ncbi:SAPS-domain-containing protein [Gigaspora margarita]|uniref:SAPS-domain-containing protein n=1 Tax=Gigaspora margarita TaxID=4874 RepID=A0A8H3X557_GIGMA|nr:SAPS-domain-containing protein [Gigaspora margarita]